jgi:hypothetical protein
MDERPTWRPTYVSGENLQVTAWLWLAEEAWPSYEVGQKVPLLSECGVTTLEVISVAEDGTIELRSQR